jgi:hypothetical protein
VEVLDLDDRIAAHETSALPSWLVLAREQLELSRQRSLRTVALVLQLRDRPRLRLMLRRYSSASSLNVICASRPLRRWRRSSATSNACDASP